jgi:hypothetical protein
MIWAARALQLLAETRGQTVPSSMIPSEYSMGSFSIWHYTVVLVALIPVLLVALVVWLTARSSRARRDAGLSSGASTKGVSGVLDVDVESRLARLGELRAQGQITDDEYARQRAAIIASI